MIAEGERVKALVNGAQTQVVLCAPFIKERVFATLLSVIPATVSVRVVTRWRAAEVAAGISDLSVFDVANERARTEVFLLDALHAKLFVADERCLVGSANLTAAALGWRPDSNLEILVSAERSDPDVSLLLERLAHATPATFQIRAEVEKEAEALKNLSFEDAQDVDPEMIDDITLPWLPRCAAPEKLFQFYQAPQDRSAIEDTKEDALSDLRDLAPVSGLSEDAFGQYISATLRQIPSIQKILDAIPGGMRDDHGEGIVKELRQNIDPSDAKKQWSIVRDWIHVFFGDQFEVAPESFVVRLKSR